MSYTHILDESVVIRDSDGAVVMPCISAQNPDYLGYVEWCKKGNKTSVIETRHPGAKELAEAREQAKLDRQTAVDAIVVTTSTGKTFDGDETSQTRMARAIIALQAAGQPSVTWVLADNTVTTATVAELSEALALAGAEQARLWVV